MSEKRYNTEEDKKEILKALEFFVSPENPDLVDPKEIKDLMDKLELRDKMAFIYNLINSLCSNRDIRRKGGLTKDEFIAYIEDKMSDAESKEGIHTIYDVFTDSNNDTLPMTNFCRTVREVGDNEKDQELKELLENADMTGKELTFDEFYEIMKDDEENKKQNLRNYKKLQPKNLYSVKYARKNYEQPEEENKNKKTPEKEEEPNRYSYKRVKVEQTKNNKPSYTQVEEKNVQKDPEEKIEEKNVQKDPEEKIEKKIVLTEIITTEQKIDAQPNNARYRYKNHINKDKNEDNGTRKQYSYKVNSKVITKEKKEENNEVENNNEDKGEGSDSKRYHRRYRASNKPNEQKTESTVTYSKYRRKV